MGNFSRRTFVRIGLAASIVAVAIGAASAAIADPSPSDGMFVISTANVAVDSPVTFWGAQWWKDNSFPGGKAPAAFKGFAAHVDLTTCTFTSTTGNTAGEPSGPLPASEAVIVAGSVSQDGSTITGTIAGLATIQTNDGYGTDPGHPGTGTVTQFTPLSCNPE